MFVKFIPNFMIAKIWFAIDFHSRPVWGYFVYRFHSMCE